MLFKIFNECFQLLTILKCLNQAVYTLQLCSTIAQYGRWEVGRAFSTIFTMNACSYCIGYIPAGVSSSLTWILSTIHDNNASWPRLCLSETNLPCWLVVNSKYPMLHNQSPLIRILHFFWVLGAHRLMGSQPNSYIISLPINDRHQSARSDVTCR